MNNFYRQFSMPPPPPPPQRPSAASATSQTPTHYDTLGVSQTATAEEIKRAFRAASLKSHPDRNPGDPTAKARFQELTGAYNVLSDSQKRAMYDAELAGGGGIDPHEMEDFMAFMMAMMSGAPPMGMPHGGMPHRGGGHMPMPMPSATSHAPAGFIFVNHGGGGAAPGSPDELQELFGQMFGGGAGIHTPQQQVTPRQDITPTPPIQSQTYTPEPLAMTLEITMQDVFMGAQMPVQIVRNIGGRKTEHETMYVDVYRGIDDGEIIVIPAKGHCIGGMYGDVKITIRVSNTTDFKRKGLDLIYVKHIGLREALGGEFEFDLKLLDDNTCTIKNKRGAVIEPNLCKTYAGMGLVRKEQRGNLLIRFIVDFPASVNEDQLGHIAAAFG